MDRRNFIKGSAAAVGAVTLPRRLYAQAAGAPEKIRFGTAVGLSGPFIDGSKSTTISQYRPLGEADQRCRRHHAVEIQQEGPGRDRLL